MWCGDRVQFEESPTPLASPPQLKWLLPVVSNVTFLINSKQKTKQMPLGEMPLVAHNNTQHITLPYKNELFDLESPKFHCLTLWVARNPKKDQFHPASGAWSPVLLIEIQNLITCLGESRRTPVPILDFRLTNGTTNEVRSYNYCY